MKKAFSVLLCVLFALTAVYPVGVLTTACFKYEFVPTSVSAYAVLFALLSVCVVVLDIIWKITIENKIIKILSAVITLLSLINAVLCILECMRPWMAISVIISFVCSYYLSVKHGKPFALKLVALILSALMTLPFAFLCMIASIFGNIGVNRVVQTVESPTGKYYAQVIDSDQGALGGDTFVDVYEKEFNFVLFKLQKKPVRVYNGDWGVYKDMEISWKDDNCLLINSHEHEIE